MVGGWLLLMVGSWPELYEGGAGGGADGLKSPATTTGGFVQFPLDTDGVEEATTRDPEVESMVMD